MKSNEFESYIKPVVNALLNAGYPKQSIILSGSNDPFDVVIVDDVSHIPIMYIECKVAINNTSLKSIESVCKNKNYAIERGATLLLAANFKDDLFELYNISNALNGENISFSNIDSLSTEIPTYEFVKSQAKVLKRKEIVKKKDRAISGLRVICWGIIPCFVIALVILDVLSIYALSVERLILIGLLFLSLLIPFFGQVSIGDLSLKRKDEGGHDDV